MWVEKGLAKTEVGQNVSQLRGRHKAVAVPIKNLLVNSTRSEDML